MSLPDDLVTRYLGQLFGHSTPGDGLHHLLTAMADPTEANAFGLPDPDKLAVFIYAIAPDGSAAEVESLIAKTVAMSVIEADQQGKVIHFAGLAVECHQVPAGVARKDVARRLQDDGKLQEHPDAFEVTRLYAACRDGRRWTGQHFLTGPKADTIVGPTLRVGGLADDERGPHSRLVRAAVRS